jgi:hypothetical protein
MQGQSPGQYILHLPSEKQTFDVAEIPVILAEARWPHVEGIYISYPLRLDIPDSVGAVLTSEDKNVLHTIWELADLPDAEFPMSENDWQRYVDAFNTSDQKPDWSLWQCFEDLSRNNAMMRAAAEEIYTKSLHNGIAQGTVSARCPITGMTVPVTDPRTQFNPDHLFLLRDEFADYARSAMFEVRDEPILSLREQRARFHQERLQAGSPSPTKDTANHFSVSDSQVRKDLRELNAQEQGGT